MIKIRDISNNYYGKENLKDDYSIKLIDGDFFEGETITVEMDGKKYKRKVYYGNGDLYITINGYKYFPSDIV